VILRLGDADQAFGPRAVAFGSVDQTDPQLGNGLSCTTGRNFRPLVRCGGGPGTKVLARQPPAHPISRRNASSSNVLRTRTATAAAMSEYTASGVTRVRIHRPLLREPILAEVSTGVVPIRSNRCKHDGRTVVPPGPAHRPAVRIGQTGLSHVGQHHVGATLREPSRLGRRE